MNELYWVVIGLLAVVYIIIGLWTLGQFFWCFGTSQSNPSSNVKFVNILITFGLILFWPLLYLWLLVMSVCGYYQHRKLKKPQPRLYTCIGKGGRYKCYGETTGAGTSRGQSVVIYQDIDTKQLFHRTRDDFNKRMKLL